MYYHLPLKKRVVIHINKHISNTHECVVPGVVEIGQEAWRRNFNVINVFSLYVTILTPWKRLWPFI